MRTIHISTYDVDGGAARAGFRLHNSLLASGTESTMLVRLKHSQMDSIHELHRTENANTYFADLFSKHYIANNRSDISTTWFSLGWPGEALAGHPLIQRADIIHLHWVSGVVSPGSLAALLKLGKPIVWTLHDQRPFTGGCHYTSGCNQFTTDCRVCPQLIRDPGHLMSANLADQARAVETGSLTVVTPSRWMAKCARQSAVFSQSRIEVIPYGIDIHQFKAIQQIEARNRLGLPADGFLLLFGVDNALEKRKGLPGLYSSLKACGNNREFNRVAELRKPSLLCFGNINAVPELPMPVRRFGRVNCDDTLSVLYSAADMFLMPSLEDNFPNTVLESISCGTPVGGFAIGGVPDMVVPGETGFLSAPGDLNGLEEIIVRGLVDPAPLRAMRTRCRQVVEERFTYQQQAKAYMALYEDLLKDPKPPVSAPAPADDLFAIDDAGPGLRSAFARTLLQVFETVPDIAQAFESVSPPEGADQRRIRFVRRVKKMLGKTDRKKRDYKLVRELFDEEVLDLKGGTTRGFRAKLIFRELLRRY